MMSPAMPEFNTNEFRNEIRKILNHTDESEDAKKWISNVESQYAKLYRRMRKQKHDHETLNEIISEIASRSLNVENLLSYIVPTIMGQFATKKVIVFRKEHRPSTSINVVTTEGVTQDVEIELQDDMPVVIEMARHVLPTMIDDLSPEILVQEPIVKLKKLGIELFIPLHTAKYIGSKGLQGFLMIGSKFTNIPFEGGELNFLSVITRMLAIAFQNESLFYLSSIDGLTGVMSRGHFEALFNDICEQMKESSTPISMIMLDLDKLKAVNDTYGHPAGDEVIRSLANIMRKQVRPSDIVARMGGEEFAVLLIGANCNVAMRVAEQIQDEMRATETVSNDITIRCTVSQGVACWPKHCDAPDFLYEKADEALLQAKERRNRIILAGTV